MKQRESKNAVNADANSDLATELMEAKHHLDLMRTLGDPLKIDLAEAALNSLLDRHSCNT